MPETDELRIFEADPKRVVSVTVGELRDLAYAASRTPEMRISIAELTAHERTCRLYQDTEQSGSSMCAVCGGVIYATDMYDAGLHCVPLRFCPQCGARTVSGNE